MKHEIDAHPDLLCRSSSAGHEHSAWIDYILALPSPVALLTAYKRNGLPTACLQSMVNFMLIGGSMIAVMAAVSRSGHFYQSLADRRQFAINYAPRTLLEGCSYALQYNRWDTDELAVAGLMAEPARRIDAPRVADCFLNLECEVLWHKAHFQGSRDAVICAQVAHVAMDPSLPAMVDRGVQMGYVCCGNAAVSGSCDATGGMDYAHFEDWE